MVKWYPNAGRSEATPADFDKPCGAGTRTGRSARSVSSGNVVVRVTKPAASWILYLRDISQALGRWCRSLPAAIPTPAGTRAGTDQRWVTVPATGRRHGRRHGRATEPVAKDRKPRSQVNNHTAADLITYRCLPAKASRFGSLLNLVSMFMTLNHAIYTPHKVTQTGTR